MIRFSALLCSLLISLTLPGQEFAAPEKTDADRAIERALEFLKSKQLADGSWEQSPAITGLAMTAFMASGHLPSEGLYGDVLDRGLEFILKSQQENGSFIKNGQMYEHGICTLLVAEVVGMTNNPRARKALDRAVSLTLRAQNVRKDSNNRGGWRYSPESTDSDLSVTGWQLLSLRAAKNAGADVPPDAIARGVEYVRRCAVSKGSGGGFGYQPGGGPNVARTGAGTLSLQLCGAYDSEEAKAGAEYLFKNPIGWGGEWYFYGLYYGTQASYQTGGKYWEQWHKKMEAALLPRQQKEGNWPYPPGGDNERRGSDYYPTVMAVLALAVQYHYLPAYQR